jgi:lysosomal Pro-X carboxypeptidase
MSTHTRGETFSELGSGASSKCPFYPGNEANVELYLNATGIMWESAEQLGAVIVFAEHRYYGKSRPAAMEGRAVGEGEDVGACDGGDGKHKHKHRNRLAYLTAEQAMVGRCR